MTEYLSDDLIAYCESLDTAIVLRFLYLWHATIGWVECCEAMFGRARAGPCRALAVYRRNG